MQEVNLNAGFLLGQALGRHMRAQKIRGRMLYITSLHAYAPRNLPHYSAAKAGQTMLVRELARQGLVKDFALGQYFFIANWTCIIMLRLKYLYNCT